jgi:alpha-tubulin suppressor-like RCC1 family protein
VKTVSCGAYHTAAVSGIHNDNVRFNGNISGFPYFLVVVDCRTRQENVFFFSTEKGEIFTWGNGSDGKLGHGDDSSR